MAYQYLLDLYKVLAERHAQLTGGKEVEKDEREATYLQGRQAAIEEFTTFLRQSYHHKLPRRLQKTLLDQR